jgi:lauroyl/myristoyl acyltransferase
MAAARRYKIAEPGREREAARKSGWLVTQSARVLPYPVLARLLSFLYGSRVLQATLFRASAELIAETLPLASGPLDARNAVRRHLLTMRLRRPEMFAVGRGSRKLLEEWFPVSGLEHLRAARERGQPAILLNSHYGAGRIIPLLLCRLGFEVHSLEGRDGVEEWQIERPAGYTVAPLGSTFLARAVAEAQLALKQGKIVHLAADGSRGQSGLEIPFLGRRRRFASGFAEMALTCGAAAFPVFARYDETGRAHVGILGPLEPADRSRSRREQVEHLLKQYVRLLEAQWRADPANVRYTQLKKYFLQWQEGGGDAPLS